MDGKGGAGVRNGAVKRDKGWVRNFTQRWSWLFGIYGDTPRQQVPKRALQRAESHGAAACGEEYMDWDDRASVIRRSACTG